MYFLNILCDILYVKVCCNLCLVINKNILQKNQSLSVYKIGNWPSGYDRRLLVQEVMSYNPSTGYNTWVENSVPRLGNLWDFGQLFKALAKINLPKSHTFLCNFCKGVKMYHFSSEIIFGQFL